MEFQILDWLQTLRTPALDAAMTFVSTLGNAGIVWIALTAALLLWRRTRRTGLAAALALLLDLLLCNILLKNLVARTRPFDINTAIELLIEKPGDFSFPSGHTAAAFAFTAALYFAGARGLGAAALALSVLMAFSRLYLYVHFPTDILGGAALGVLCGFLGARLARRFWRRDGLRSH